MSNLKAALYLQPFEMCGADEAPIVLEYGFTLSGHLSAQDLHNNKIASDFE
jgi:hypothetical protein